MHLESITTCSCPHCGCATVVSESVDTSNGAFGPVEVLEHCHGGKWERREFLCGYAVKFIPNFDREQQDGGCRNSLKEKLRRKVSDQFSVLRSITYNFGMYERTEEELQEIADLLEKVLADIKAVQKNYKNDT